MRYLVTLLFLLALAVNVCAQDKYDIKQVRLMVYDKSGQPWNDASAFLGVKLDTTKNNTLEDQEITAGTTSYNVGGDFQRFGLKFDAGGNCYAEVNLVVYKGNDSQISYELALLKKEGEKYVTVPLTNRTIAVSRTTPDKYSINASIFRPMLLTDWALYGGIMLASILFVYFVLFRWLFSVLLFNHSWPVSRAEYFTTSLSLLMILAVFGFLMAIFLPHTVVVWTVLTLLTIFWVGHAITWALS